MNTELTNEQAEELAGMAALEAAKAFLLDNAPDEARMIEFMAGAAWQACRQAAAPTPPSAPVQQSVADELTKTATFWKTAFYEAEEVHKAEIAALSTSPLLDKNDQTEGKEIFAWAEFDGEGGYDLRLYEDNEEYRDEYIARNGEKYSDWVMPLYTHPKPPQPDSNELVEAIRENERAFQHKSTGDIEYVLSGENTDDWKEIMIIPNISNETIDAALAQSPSVGLNTKKGGQ